MDNDFFPATTGQGSIPAARVRKSAVRPDEIRDSRPDRMLGIMLLVLFAASVFVTGFITGWALV